MTISNGEEIGHTGLNDNKRVEEGTVSDWNFLVPTRNSETVWRAETKTPRLNRHSHGEGGPISDR